MKAETKFRVNHVLPFLQTLKNTTIFPIQQLAIIGDPDFVLCCNGRFVALELKKGDEDPRELQLYKLESVRRTKGIAIVAEPGNWETVKRLLLKLDQGEPI